jgi:succinate dehydrogenase / fumarate reductase cytochrome b subunit
MGWWSRTWNSSIGMKTIMALTGAGLFLFVIGHLLGNLQIFLGPHALNAYARNLRLIPEALWVARIGLIALLLAHVGSAVRLTRLNRAARPNRYRVQKTVQVNYAARTLFMSGLIVLAFVIFHLLHFTLGRIDPAHYHLTDELGHHDVYSMVIWGFSNPILAAAYLLATLVLALHLRHGVSSLFQTLGLSTPRYEPLFRRIGPIVALVILLGYWSIPLSVLLGWIHLPAGGN